MSPPCTSTPVGDHGRSAFRTTSTLPSRVILTTRWQPTAAAYTVPSDLQHGTPEGGIETSVGSGGEPGDSVELLHRLLQTRREHRQLPFRGHPADQWPARVHGLRPREATEVIEVPVPAYCDGAA